MVIRQRNLQSSEVYFAEFYDVPKTLLNWFDAIAYENNCYIEKKEWKSKYNSYVIYDYEPFCSDGFEINIVLSSNSLNNVGFVKYLYTKKLKTINFFNKCMDV
ncbi:MAG: hypothetical protein PHX18_05005 [Candidatus Gastranaerophilales bacterium]|nr:hypothetical protein [Candidatus Gastranaerophilales bacterium]